MVSREGWFPYRGTIHCSSWTANSWCCCVRATDIKKGQHLRARHIITLNNAQYTCMARCSRCRHLKGISSVENNSQPLIGCYFMQQRKLILQCRMGSPLNRRRICLFFFFLRWHSPFWDKAWKDAASKAEYIKISCSELHRTSFQLIDRGREGRRRWSQGRRLHRATQEFGDRPCISPEICMYFWSHPLWISLTNWMHITHMHWAGLSQTNATV